MILTVIQLLLVNLAMDTLAAIAFGSEPALPEYMKDRPVARKASIISKGMLIEIITGAVYITVVCLAMLKLWASLLQMLARILSELTFCSDPLTGAM